jgi:tetrapyrrole methylase family protein/MazG family protein
MAENRENASFRKLTAVVRRLRKECPWDREQTHMSLRSSLIEEAYETVESIESGNMNELKQELGDLLLQVVLHGIIAGEKKDFTLDEIIDSITKKMIRRHPHVFGSTIVKTADDVKRNWEHIKMTEGRRSVISGVPRKMPALLRAHRIQEKASKVGFDWKNKKDVWKKVTEELKEFREAERSRKKERVEEEFGDLLFSLVNYSRFAGINPEFALRSAIRKFSRRFRHVENELERRGKKIGKVSLKEMDKIWNARKKLDS